MEREDTRAGARVQGSFLATAICGYVVFLAIVLVFHVWLAGESDALISAVWGGLFLSVTALGASAFTTLVVPLLRGQKVGRRRQARPPRGVGLELIPWGGSHADDLGSVQVGRQLPAGHEA